MAGISSKGAGSLTNKYQYNGKEKQSNEFSNGSGLDWYYFGARMYDEQIGKWNMIDPLAYKRDWLTPYNFVQNNPLIRIDPNGETDYKLNQKTGEITQVGDENDKPDRLLKTNRKGEVKKNGNGFLVKKSERGKPKVAIDGIAKGILTNGINFKTQNQVVDVGGSNQPSTKDVKYFMVKFADYINKEIKGYEFSPKGAGNISHIYIGLYRDNTDTRSYAGIVSLPTMPTDFLKNVDIQSQFHTHLTKFSDRERFSPSPGDVDDNLSDSGFGIKNFQIITSSKNISY